jgi:hypothetical protein
VSRGSGISLRALIEALAEEGVVGEEADAIVERVVAERQRKRGTALARRGGSGGIAFPASPQEDTGAQGVDYGDETPEEAKARWMEQEMNDPNGVFAGGSTAGGIFGNASIATEGYDPDAHMRSVSMVNATRQAQLQVKQTQLLEAIMERLGPPQRGRRELPAPQARQPRGRLRGKR